MKIKLKFSFTRKYFSLTNFTNGKKFKKIDYKKSLYKKSLSMEQTCLAVKTFQKKKKKIREILGFQEIEKLPLFLLM